MIKVSFPRKDTLEDSPLTDNDETDYATYSIGTVFFLRGETHGTA